MLQKRNDLEIIESIRYEPKHIRKIATELNLIPSTVMRTLRALEDEGIVDYNEAGRNKSYFLKQTLETKSYLFITEEYKKMKLIQNIDIRGIIENILEITKNELIILFGSYAAGSATNKSDIDIYIETTSASLKRKISNISDKLSVKSGKLEISSFLGQEIIRNHVIITNTERFYQIQNEQKDNKKISKSRRSKNN